MPITTGLYHFEQVKKLYLLVSILIIFFVNFPHLFAYVYEYHIGFGIKDQFDNGISFNMYDLLIFILNFLQYHLLFITITQRGRVEKY